MHGSDPSWILTLIILPRNRTITHQQLLLNCFPLSIIPNLRDVLLPQILQYLRRLVGACEHYKIVRKGLVDLECRCHLRLALPWNTDMKIEANYLIQRQFEMGNFLSVIQH